MVLLVKDTILNLVLLFAFTKREWTTYGHAVTLQFNSPKKKKQSVTLPTDDTHLLLTEMKTSFRNHRWWKYLSKSQTVLLGTSTELKSNTFDTDTERGIKRIHINGVSE